MSEANYVWLNDLSQQFLERGYLLPGQTVDERINIIANRAEKVLGEPGFAKAFKENFQKGWYSLSTPIWCNFGTDRALPISCFGSVCQDSMDSILYTQAEVGMMTKHGGGTSGYFGDVRGRGEPIRDNGKSSGSVHFMQLFDQLINVVSQGSCYIEKTEVLTNNGFKDFRDVKVGVDKLAQLDEYNNITFTDEFELTSNSFEGNLSCYRAKKRGNTFLKVTPNHRMVIEKRKTPKKQRMWPGYTEIVEAKNLNVHRDNRFIIAGKAKSGKGLSFEDRFKIAFQADGRKDGDNKKIRFKFRKDRKINRLLWIINNLKLEYKIDIDKDDNTNIILEPNNDLKKTYFSDWIKLENLTYDWCYEFIYELSHWDGSIAKNNGKGLISYSSIDKSNIDMIQSIAAMCQKKSRVRIRNAYENRVVLYTVLISNTNHRGGDSVEKYDEEYSGMVYCAIVPNGRLIVKYDGVTTVCGNTRRGNFAAYLPIDHKDINEFLGIRSEGHPIQDLSFGVCVDDDWMESMISGDGEKRKVWAKVLQSRANVGYPYIFFSGNANKGKPDVYKDKEMEILSSNLCCVTGDQSVLHIKEDNETFDYESVKKLYEYGKPIRVFNGEAWVNASPMKLVSPEEDVYKITLLNGVTHTVTACHRIQTNRGVIRLDEIKIGDFVHTFTSKKESSMVISIDHMGREPVYCLEVDSEDHLWVCNDVITHNSEIMLPSNEQESFVCDLSSMNISKYDEWKGTNAVRLLVKLLDAVMTEFIEKASKIRFMERAVRFAERHRALGIGWIGWHSYLQKNMISFESMEAKLKNVEIIKFMRDEAYAASAELAERLGEPELLKGYGRRNTTLLAIAPTKSSSFILGQESEGIEPCRTNLEIKDLAKGKFTLKNKYLEKLLEEKDQNTDEVWKSIRERGGSVQHLSCLTDHEKAVFKTFGEISPKEVIIQAAQRQKYIDQGQSLNLMIHPSIPIKDVNALIIEAWRLGCKALYYQFSVNASQAFARDILNCTNCEA